MLFSPWTDTRIVLAVDQGSYLASYLRGLGDQAPHIWGDIERAGHISRELHPRYGFSFRKSTYGPAVAAPIWLCMIPIAGAA